FPMSLIPITILVFFCDWLSKFLVQRNLSPGESYTLVDNVLSLTYLRNPGAFFGLLSGEATLIIFLNFAIIVLITIIWLKVMRGKWQYEVGLGMILGGTLGNLWDRIGNGVVIDFVDLNLWPVFNLADVFLCIGVGIIIFGLIKQELK
ncbi:MAG: signal peptidase II, partial [Candidatus Aerophobetes bacterium]